MNVNKKKMQIVIDNYFKKECDVNVYIQNHNLIELRKSFLGSDIYEQD